MLLSLMPLLGEYQYLSVVPFVAPLTLSKTLLFHPSGHPPSRASVGGPSDINMAFFEEESLGGGDFECFARPRPGDLHSAFGFSGFTFFEGLVTCECPSCFISDFAAIRFLGRGMIGAKSKSSVLRSRSCAEGIRELTLLVTFEPISSAFARALFRKSAGRAGVN